MRKNCTIIVHTKSYIIQPTTHLANYSQSSINYSVSTNKKKAFMTKLFSYQWKQLIYLVCSTFVVNQLFFETNMSFKKISPPVLTFSTKSLHQSACFFSRKIHWKVRWTSKMTKIGQPFRIFGSLYMMGKSSKHGNICFKSQIKDVNLSN